MRLVRCLLVLVGLMQAVANAETVTSVPEADVEQEPESCDALASTADDLLICARTGTWHERLRAGNLLIAQLSIDDSSADDAAALEGDIDLVILMMRQEMDDWIACEWLDNLVYESAPGLDRLFRAALREDSVNLKAKALEWLEGEDDPQARGELNRLWRDDLPGWLRARLIETMAWQEMDEHLRDFIELTEDDDPDIRAAAIEGLGTLGLEEAEPALLRAASRGSRGERELALDSLSELPATDAILRELAQAANSDDASMRQVAITALGNIEHPEATRILMDIVERSRDNGDLRVAVEALSMSEGAEVTAALARLAGRVGIDSDEWLVRRILRILESRRDVSALAGLASIGQAAREVLGSDLDDVVEGLSQVQPDAGGTQHIVFSCRRGSSVDPEDRDARRIAPSPPYETVRCWEAPSVAGESWEEDRLRAGTLVTIEDHFERPEGTWVEIDGDDVDCWVPLSDLVAADTPPPVTDPTRRPHIEFDLPARDALSAPARHLIEAGLMEILESEGDDQVVAAALSIDPKDQDQIAMLGALWIDGWGALDRAIDRLRHACCGPLP